MRMNEMLAQFGSLKKAAQAQQEAFEKKEAGAKAPEISAETLGVYESTVRNMMGDYENGRVKVRETLMSTDAIKLVPKIIEGQLREAAEPEYLATRFMQTINVDGQGSAVYVVPIVGEVTAHEVAEGGRYQEANVDFSTVENSALEVRVKKIGAKITVTEESINDSSWDILAINIRKMGRAMARYKEEWAMNNFSDNGHAIFNNSLRSQLPEAGTTGHDETGELNDTLSVEDFLDLVLAVMGQGFNPSDVIMHPLTWVIFARNSMIGNGLTYGAFGGSQVHPWGATQGTPGFAGLAADQGPQKLIMRPEQVQNRLPVPITMNFSPFVKFDKVNKRFDMYVLDRNEVGVIVQKEGLSTDNWTDPERDIQLMKVKERYGIGITNNGRAIAVAQGIAVAPTFPVPPVVRIKQD